MLRIFLSFMLMSFVAASAQTSLTLTQQTGVTNVSCSNISMGRNGSLNGFVPSSNDIWHQDISSMPLDPLSSTIVTSAADLGGYHLHPDFGTQSGIPYNVVDTSLFATAQGAMYGATQQNVPMQLYAGDSDLTAYPVYPTLAVEGAPPQCPTDDNDRHLLIIDRHSCTNYEMYQAALCNGSWTASNGLLFDMLTTEQRPYGATSADASGLSVFEGLIRYDEILAGTINHAIRFTTPNTKANQNGGYFVSPATHAAGSLYGTDDIMGMRIRLQANYDISGFSKTNQIILTAMKKYGLILTDNGSKLFFQGTADARWNDNDLVSLESVLSSSFEVVQMPTKYDSSTAPTGTAPVITNFVATAGNYKGTPYYLLSANISGATYSFMSGPGVETGSIFRGQMAVTPTAATTYTLISRNLYGTTKATVSVQAVQ